MKFLQTSKYCPLCSTKIHETQPLLNLKLDRVMQDIVYKLVPGLQESKCGWGLWALLVSSASWALGDGQWQEIPGRTSLAYGQQGSPS